MPAPSDGFDTALLREAVHALQRRADLEVVLGGIVDESGSMNLGGLVGTATPALRDLHVVPRAGLGGRVLDVNRPVSVDDYLSSPMISHHYDRAIAAEGLRAMFAVPVGGGRRARMVLYGGTRGPVPFGERTLGAAVGVARWADREAAVRGEVERRTAELRRAAQPRFTVPDSRQWDRVRAAHVELRRLVHQTPDAALRERIAEIAGSLAQAPGDADDPAPPRLSDRELDVLACVGLGCSNAEAAGRLGILPETAKSYLASAMRKLGVHDRHAAATTARRLGLLP